MTDGIYISDPIDMGSGRGNAYNYMRFHEDGIFYYGQMAQPSTAGGGMSAAGYWKTVEESYTFYNGVAVSDKEITVGEMTVSSYIELTNFDGTPYNNHQTNGDAGNNASPVYDNKYPMMNDVLLGVWYADLAYTHDVDNETYTIDKETAIEVAYFVKTPGESDGLILNHTGAFEDLVSSEEDIYEGSWSCNVATRTYTLKDGNKTATLVVSEDGMTAEYTDFTGTKQNLYSVNYTEGVKEVLKVTANSFFNLSFYNDGTYKVWAEMGGQTSEFTTGKWSLTIPTLKIDTTDYTMTADGVSLSFTVTTSNGDTPLSFALSRDQLVALSQVTIIEAKPIVEVTSAFFKLGFYADGTYKVIAEMGTTVQEMKTGTWSLTIPTLTVDEANYTMSADGVTVKLSLTTSQGSNEYDFVMTRDQLLALNA